MNTEYKTALKNTIIQQIREGRGADGKQGMICWDSWGAEFMQCLDETHENRGGIAFRTIGFKHKGIVFVWLTWSDTYTLEFKPDSGEKTVLQDILCWDLTEVIDSAVEYTGPDYSSNCSKHLSIFEL